MRQHLLQLDTVINKLCMIRNTINENREVEFDIDHLLPIVETSVDALAQEIDEEMKP